MLFRSVNVTCGEDEITMDELGEITDYIQDAAGMTAEVIKGYGVDSSLGDKVNVTIIATGFNSSADSGIQIERAPAKKIFSLMDEVKKEEPKVVEFPMASKIAKLEEMTSFIKGEMNPASEVQKTEEKSVALETSVDKGEEKKEVDNMEPFVFIREEIKIGRASCRERV